MKCQCKNFVPKQSTLGNQRAGAVTQTVCANCGRWPTPHDLYFYDLKRGKRREVMAMIFVVSAVALTSWVLSQWWGGA